VGAKSTKFQTLSSEIIDRNDIAQHSREKIAGWLRRVAKLTEPPAYWPDVR